MPDPRSLRSARAERRPSIPGGPTEHDEQAALMRWAHAMRSRRPDLRVLFAVPNGGARDARTAAKMKAEGVRAGVPDLCLPVVRTGPGGRIYGALWIEMKRPEARSLFAPRRAGTLTDEQRAWIDALAESGQAVAVCYGMADAVRVLEDYLDGLHANLAAAAPEATPMSKPNPFGHGNPMQAPD